MKLLFHHRIASRDGQSVHLDEMMAAFQLLGHEAVLVGPAGLAGRGPGGSSRAIGLIKRAIPASCWEVLELAYNVPALLRLMAAIRRHRPDAIYERFSLFLLAGLWARRLSGLPLLLEVNSPLFEERAAHDGLAQHRLARFCQRLLWRGADHVLPVTGVLARMVMREGVGPGRVSVVPNGIDPARFAGDVRDTDTETVRKRRIVLGFTGFVRDWNATHRLLDVAARAGRRFDLGVVVVGDGPTRASLEARAAELGLGERLTITGAVGRDEVARRVRGFDIAVLPGVTPYASPLKLFEYLQLGCAVVAPDQENIREILTDRHDALLFDPGSPDAMERAVLELCEDPLLRARLGRNGAGTIADRSLTWKRNAERVAAIATDLISRRASRPRS